VTSTIVTIFVLVQLAIIPALLQVSPGHQKVNFSLLFEQNFTGWMLFQPTDRVKALMGILSGCEAGHRAKSMAVKAKVVNVQD